MGTNPIGVKRQEAITMIVYNMVGSESKIIGEIRVLENTKERTPLFLTYISLGLFHTVSHVALL